MSLALAAAEDTILRGVVAAQVAAHTMTDNALDKVGSTVRKYRTAENRVAWFVVVIPLVAFLAIVGLAAWLTVKCWDRGYSGFTGNVDIQRKGTILIKVHITFSCF